MIHYKIYQKISEVPSKWDSLSVSNIFLNTKYLKALEAASPKNISLFYICFYKNDNMVGIALIQRVELYLKDIFRNTSVSFFKTIVKDSLSKVLKGNILVVGNLTHTGQHAIYFNTEKVLKTEFYKSLFVAITDIKTRIKKTQKKTIRLILLKDFFKNDSMLLEKFLNEEKLEKVSVQPNMTMAIRDSWHCNIDYVSAMNKKYRARYRRAKKKLGGIECRELTLNDIQKNSKTLHQLYMNVSSNATFNTFVLPEHHFYTYKYYLLEKFKVFGYYYKEDLVGFFTLILNHTQLETYFLGYNPNYQYKNQLYLNMLYDMASFGIEHSFKHIVYARTAMEIKSSVGATPQNMYLYLKHTNSILNMLLKQIFKVMNPLKEWEERHPFN